MPTSSPPIAADHIAAVRGFNRTYTRLMGLLHEYLDAGDYTLTEARVLFELAHSEPVEVIELRRWLDIDPGYLSRILSRFEADELVRRQRSTTDGRRQQVRLTEPGRKVFTEVNDRASKGIASLLGRYSPEDQTQIVHAMRTLDTIMNQRAPTEFVIRDPRPGDYGWVIEHNALCYAAEYGWDGSYEALVARIVADYLSTPTDSRRHAWVAERGGQRLGAVFCVPEDDHTARLRLLLVEPSARGSGIGSALVDECLRFATEAGYRRMVLWTNDILAAARRIYERSGFVLIDSEPHHSFGHDLVGQTWARSL